MKIIEDFSRRSADFRRQLGQGTGRALRGKITRKRMARFVSSAVVLSPTDSTENGFNTDSASASPQDFTDYTDSTDVCGESVGASGRT